MRHRGGPLHSIFTRDPSSIRFNSDHFPLGQFRKYDSWVSPTIIPDRLASRDVGLLIRRVPCAPVPPQLSIAVSHHGKRVGGEEEARGQQSAVTVGRSAVRSVTRSRARPDWVPAATLASVVRIYGGT